MPFLYEQGRVIHYEFHPSPDAADVLVLLHGLGLDLSEWDEVIPLLQPQFHLLRYDLAGHGKSSNDRREQLTFERLSEDLCMLTNSLGMSSYHLVGDSFGGKICVYHAIRQPERVKSLILSTVPCRIGAMAEPTLQFFRSMAGNLKELAEYVVPRICYPVNERKSEKLYRMFAQVSPEVYLAALRLLLHSFPAEQLKQVKQPALFLWGERDPFIPQATIPIVYSDLPRSRTLIVPNASQMMYMDQPDMVSTWIRDFVTSQLDQARPLFHDWFLAKIKAHAEEITKTETSIQTSAPTLDIKLVSTFRVFIDGQEIVGNWNKRHAKRLLIYLLFHRTVTREQLYELFWPGWDIENARNSLRVSLAYLKKLLTLPSAPNGCPFLCVDRQHISLTGTIGCDLFELAEEVEYALQQGDVSLKFDVSQKISQQLFGAFVPGMYDDWVLSMRNRVMEQIISLMHLVSSHLETEGKYEKAANLLASVVHSLDHHEELYERIVTSYRKAGKKQEAEIWNRKKEQYENHYLM